MASTHTPRVSDKDTLISLLRAKTPMAAMLAPSFPIMFSYPDIVTTLRAAGFSHVAEVARGAQETNKQLSQFLTEHPDHRVITSPCPTVTRMIKTSMSQYAHYLTTTVDSPMVATAKLVHQLFPGEKAVFIGPCVMKKQEAKDYPDLDILVLTYWELSQILDELGINTPGNPSDTYDLAADGPTRAYAMDGGLSESSGLTKTLPDGAVRIVSGAKNNAEAIRAFDTDASVRVLDILNCPGGCINGPGIHSPLSTEERISKIKTYGSQIHP